MPVEAREVWHRYGDDWVLKDINLAVGAAETVAVMGPSGSGKTTLLAIMGALLAPTRGHVTYGDSRQAGQARRESAMLLDLGWVFQTGNALMSRSVVDNVVIGLLPLGHSRRAAEVIAKRVLTEVGLSHRVDSQTATLSGGELQRLNVARAVAREPTVILADEPTAHLDRATATEIVDRLTSVIDSDTSVIVATHDPLVAAACSRTVDIRYGEIVNAVTDAHS